jgi:hypothetical protein
MPVLLILSEDEARKIGQHLSAMKPCTFEGVTMVLNGKYTSVDLEILYADPIKVGE